LVDLALKIEFATEDAICFFLNALIGGVVAPNLRGFSFVNDRDWEQAWARECDLPVICAMLNRATNERLLKQFLGFDSLCELICSFWESSFAGAAIKVRRILAINK
jgi:hypothetical protein